MKIEGSSQLKDIEYDNIKKILTVTFHSGDRWNYQPVGATNYQNLLHAKSKGEHFSEHIKKNKTIVATKVGGTPAHLVKASVKVDSSNKPTIQLESENIQIESKDFHKLGIHGIKLM